VCQVALTLEVHQERANICLCSLLCTLSAKNSKLEIKQIFKALTAYFLFFYLNLSTLKSINHQSVELHYYLKTAKYSFRKEASTSIIKYERGEIFLTLKLRMRPEDDRGVSILLISKVGVHWENELIFCSSL